MASDLLFELGTEELPSGAVLPLADALTEQLVTRLAKAGVQHGDVQSFATPRRLAVLIHGVDEQQANQTISRKGPAVAAGKDKNGEPTQALIGFAKSCGVTVEALTTVETDKGQWWYYEAVTSGAKTCELLPGLLTDSLKALPISKPMRWGACEAEFVRPVHWAVLLFGNDVISCELLGVETGRQSYGHRFHHPEAVEIVTPTHYESALRGANVIADFSARRQMIQEQIQSLATSANLTAVMPDDLLDEVTSIVEWPVALMINFESKFLEVPSEALIASMQSHQKCFALRNEKGALVPHFITVSNIQSTQPEQVIAGNEKVMRARLSDAAFFYHQDKRQPLMSYRSMTADVLFQAKLGSLLDKSERIACLMNDWVQPLALDAKQVARAASLCKCDLMTGMVGEFPELQGLMGFYYAQHDGEDASVALALNEQYMPRFASDHLPTSDLGRALSLADRLDTLVGTFAIGQRPTGVKDPFKLRRHALAVIRLLVQMPKAPSLSSLLEQSLASYKAMLQPEVGAIEALRLFILERMYAFYEGQGITSDLVQAVRAQQDNHLFDVEKRLKALQAFVVRPEAERLSAACKRVNNLLQHVSITETQNPVDLDLLQEPAERGLYERLESIALLVTPLYDAHEYETVLGALASLREPVDEFFEKVMVMVDNESIKQNRLNLLGRLQSLLQGVADISLLELGS